MRDLKFKTRSSSAEALSQLFKMAESYADTQIANDEAVARALGRESTLKNNIATDFNNFVDNIVTPSDITAANTYSEGLDSIVANDPEAFFTKKS